MAKTIKAVPVKDFKDAGTKKSFKAGVEADFTEGEHANFMAAGLLKKPEADKKPA
ncbi:hypothetical protein [Croceicoccus sp. BE223]|uniref:hypothetical protein n=1 Tax=Croceicoccus sp. BE223 TaxID=2817716 RepID=UPI00285520AA|nr:hypothetical protein [Croceicoccus sp. BE223]MDR7101523.1 hypothetical protein [Croceicoccus sp. BE223]